MDFETFIVCISLVGSVALGAAYYFYSKRQSAVCPETISDNNQIMLNSNDNPAIFISEVENNTQSILEEIASNKALILELKASILRENAQLLLLQENTQLLLSNSTTSTTIYSYLYSLPPWFFNEWFGLTLDQVYQILYFGFLHRVISFVTLILDTVVTIACKSFIEFGPLGFLFPIVGLIVYTAYHLARIYGFLKYWSIVSHNIIK